MLGSWDLLATSDFRLDRAANANQKGRGRRGLVVARVVDLRRSSFLISVLSGAGAAGVRGRL